MKTPLRLHATLFAVAIAIVLLGTGFSSFALAQEPASTPGLSQTQNAPVQVAPIVDVTPPAIIQSPNLVVAAVDGSGSTVTWPVPVATDETNGPLPVGCDWGSGAIFPLGTTTVSCTARDAAGNASVMAFLVTVVDQTPPVISVPYNVVVDAVDGSGASVAFAIPTGWDNVNGAVVVGCDWQSGAFFPVGATMVTCSAFDLSGNAAAPVAFQVIVNPPPAPLPVMPQPTLPPVIPESTEAPVTPEPTASADPAESPVQAETPTEATGTPARELDGTPVPSPTLILTPSATETSAPSPTPQPSPTQEATPTETVTPTPSPTVAAETPVPPMLDLPWPLPGSFAIDVYGGPLNGLQAIWGNAEYPITQEFGHTGFSVAHSSWYSYGLSYGLDGFEHPGIDIGMPAGTWLYSPVNGRVSISGDSPYYTYYGNGAPNVGELLIVTDSGDEVILGHMGRIAVNVGDYVTVGQFVGLSGGDNGDHLHLETRALQSGTWFLAVDPRSSFLIPSLQAAAEPGPQDAAAQQPPLTPTPDVVGADMALVAGPLAP